MSIAASSCRHARKSLFLHAVGHGPRLARQNQERLGDPQLSLGSVREQVTPGIPLLQNESEAVWREKHIRCLFSSCTPILHQFLPILLLLKGLHTLDRTVAFGCCSKKRQSGCIHRSGWHGPCSSAFSVP